MGYKGMLYRPTRQDAALFVHLKLYCVKIKYFHSNVMGLGIDMVQPSIRLHV